MGREPYQPAHAFRAQWRLTHAYVKRAQGVLHGIGDRGRNPYPTTWDGWRGWFALGLRRLKGRAEHEE